jgi:hypothetical protein
MDATRNQKYHEVGLHDDTHRNGNGDTMRAFIGHEKGDLGWSDDGTATEMSMRTGKAARTWAAVLNFRSILDTVLLLVVLGLLLERRWQKSGTHDSSHPFEGTGDITGFAPRFSQQIKKFSPDPAFVPENGSEFFTDAVHQKWLSIVPSASSLVHAEFRRNRVG